MEIEIPMPKFIKSNIKYILLIAGICSLAVSINSATHEYNFTRSAKKTTAVVIKNDAIVNDDDNDNDGSDTPSYNYYPEYKYKVNGVNYTNESRIGTGKPEYNVGDKINIYYDPKHPKISSINSFFEKWLNSILTATAGLLLIIAAVLMIKLRGRSFRKVKSMSFSKTL